MHTCEDVLECQFNIASIKSRRLDEREIIVTWRKASVSICPKYERERLAKRGTSTYLRTAWLPPSVRPSSASDHSCFRRAWWQCWSRHDHEAPSTTGWHCRRSGACWYRRQGEHPRHLGNRPTWWRDSVLGPPYPKSEPWSSWSRPESNVWQIQHRSLTLSRDWIRCEWIGSIG